MGDIDRFDDVLSKEDRDFLNKYYATSEIGNARTQFLYNNYFETYPAACEKFNKEERDLFKKQPVCSRIIIVRYCYEG